ncbi:MAG TPA: rhomboid family intramembrane serine protease [Flavobacterium sp.]|nr:rhomboid family intramembrane serine protease [Flavobacterium sp.]
MINITPVVKQLLIINIIFFIGSQLPNLAYEYLSLFYFENPKFQFWQPITHMFMHGSIMHIAFNMLALYSFGSNLESIWGGKKFLFFYISCGLGAAALHTLVNYYHYQDGYSILFNNGFSSQEISSLLNGGQVSLGGREAVSQQSLQSFYSAYHTRAVGASGAIYGLLVAFAFMFPNAELMMLFIPVPIKAKYFVPGLLALDLFLGVSGKSIFGGGNGVAHFAHIGGAIIGFLMMWYWKKNQFSGNRWN